MVSVSVVDIVFVENHLIANGISVVVRLVFHQSETPVEAQTDALCNSLADDLKQAVHINFIPDSLICAFDRKYIFRFFKILLFCITFHLKLKDTLDAYASLIYVAFLVNLSIKQAI